MARTMLKRFLGIACVAAVLPLFAQSPDAPADVQEPGQLAQLINKAKDCLGRPYRFGGTTSKGFDCSGFVRYVFSSIGVDLSRSSGAQAKQGEPVDLNHLLPGDLLFFSTRGMRRGISHVAIYLGDGKFIHASNWGGPGKRCVRFGELASKYFTERLVTARRVLDPLQALPEDDKRP